MIVERHAFSGAFGTWERAQRQQSSRDFAASLLCYSASPLPISALLCRVLSLESFRNAGRPARPGNRITNFHIALQVVSISVNLLAGVFWILVASYLFGL